MLPCVSFHRAHLQSKARFKTIANRLLIRVVDCLLNEQRVDIFSPLETLKSKTVLEYCITENLVEVFEPFVTQINDSSRISETEFHRFLKLAFENNAHEIIVYLIDNQNISLQSIHNIAALISSLKYTIQNNKLAAFKAIFQQLCFLQNITINEEIDDLDDSSVQIYQNKQLPDRDLHPKVCCVLPSTNVRLPLPEYDANDILYEGYVLEALLAYSTHVGNILMLRYIYLKANMTITNRLIATIMRLLPKEINVCHQKSMSAFQYLLDNTTDLDSMDEKSQNLLHMTAQNGCFFMLHCLVARGFNPATINPTNGWKVFHSPTNMTIVRTKS